MRGKVSFFEFRNGHRRFWCISYGTILVVIVIFASNLFASSEAAHSNLSQLRSTYQTSVGSGINRRSGSHSKEKSGYHEMSDKHMKNENQIHQQNTQHELMNDNNVKNQLIHSDHQSRNKTSIHGKHSSVWNGDTRQSRPINQTSVRNSNEQRGSQFNGKHENYEMTDKSMKNKNQFYQPTGQHEVVNNTIVKEKNQFNYNNNQSKNNNTDYGKNYLPSTIAKNKSENGNKNQYNHNSQWPYKSYNTGHTEKSGNKFTENKKYFRLVVKLLEPYVEEFSLNETNKFQQKSRQIISEIGIIFPAPDFKECKVIAITKTNDKNASKLYIDLPTNKAKSQKDIQNNFEKYLERKKQPDLILFSKEKLKIIGYDDDEFETCPTSTLPCEDGIICYPVSGRCNGYTYCSDKSDELDCPGKDDKNVTQNHDLCKEFSKYHCHEGGRIICRSEVCDGIQQCIFGEDEVDCIESPSKPQILSNHPENATVVAYSKVKFSCPTSSKPQTSIEWRKSNHQITVKNYESAKIVQKKSTVITKTANILSIPNVTKENEGWYACIAQNKLGLDISNAYLRVIIEINSSQRTDKKFIILIILIIVLIVIMTAVTLLFYKKKTKSSEKKILLTQWIKRITIHWQESTYGNFAETVEIPVVKIEKQRRNNLKNNPDVEYEMPKDDEWEFPRGNLEFIDNIGEGNFGKVKLAKAFSILKENRTSMVAVKMLKDFYTDHDVIDLVQEMEVMKMIGKHKNILALLGCCTRDGPLYVITEYALYGNFLSFLRKHKLENTKYELPIKMDFKVDKRLSLKDLISFAHQVAQGMQYLSSKRFIHRDLAACNILVFDDYVIKISDFGLVRDFGWNDYYRKTTNGRLPVKWMAPEALFYRKYSIRSDVWSFGILLWEIMTLGGTPYPSVTKIEQLYPLIRNGYRMEKPDHCSSKMYKIMQECWTFECDGRPTFSELVDRLDKILKNINTIKNRPASIENLSVHNPLHSCNSDLSKSTFHLRDIDEDF